MRCPSLHYPPFLSKILSMWKCGGATSFADRNDQRPRRDAAARVNAASWERARLTFLRSATTIHSMKSMLNIDCTRTSRATRLLCGLCFCLTSGFVIATAGQTSKTGTIKGRVVNEKGKPIVGATVKATNTRDHTVKDTKTDDSGNYLLELPADEYLVGFQAEGFQEGSLQALQQVEEGKETRIKEVILPKATHTSLVRGSVFNLRGQTLAGVKVVIVRIPNDEETQSGKHIKSLSRDYLTNQRGEFAFRLPAQPARYRLTASAHGLKTDTKVVDVSGSEAVPVALTLLPIKDKD
jgi:hypothetical protein